MYDIFLSYSSQDREYLQLLVEKLEAEGWTVFWDHRSIKVAQDWHEVVGKAIQDCPCVVVVWSKSSVVSRWVKEEAIIARDRGVLYPIMIDQVAPPFGFNLIQAADFTEWDGGENHQEFVELKEQLSMRLNLRRKFTRPVAPSSPLLKTGYVRPTMQGIMGKHTELNQLTGRAKPLAVPRFGFKLIPGLGILVVIAGLVYWFLQPSNLSETPVAIPSKQRPTAKSEPPVIPTLTPAVAATVTVPLPEPETYTLNIKTKPVGAAVRIDGKPLQAGQRFRAGTYQVSITADGYKSRQEDVDIKDVSLGLSIVLERLPMPFEPTMVQIPGGTFQMGCGPQRDGVGKGCDNKETPLHTVTVPTFWLSETEITVGQYYACVDVGVCPAPEWAEHGNPLNVQTGTNNRYRQLGESLQGSHYPVVGVSWNNAQTYVNWLSQATGVEYRLPSESEWEYAARARSNHAYTWGPDANHNRENYGRDDCCYRFAEGRDKWLYTAPVGSFPSNFFGLKDMHGNVSEWVEDCWHASYKDAPNNGMARSNCSAGSLRVLRGGSWYGDRMALRAAHRVRFTSSHRDEKVGFRIAKMAL